jgi:hypothetical protein
MTSTSGRVRASGKTAAEEEAKRISEESDDDVTAAIEEESTEKPLAQWRTPGFARMRIDWRGDDVAVIHKVQHDVDARVAALFVDAYQVLSDIYDIVREPEVGPDGVIRRDPITGFIIWKRTESGAYIEDWNQLTKVEAKDFMFRITTRQFDWRQRATNAWGEAMMAKAQWEERFAIAFDAPMRDTVQGREAKGRIDAADERYFAIFVTLFSKKCDAIVESMDKLAARMETFLRY